MCAPPTLVSQYGVEITAIITETIERWDARKPAAASNCTSVATCNSSGSMNSGRRAGGLAIYAIAQLLF